MIIASIALFLVLPAALLSFAVWMSHWTDNMALIIFTTFCVCLFFIVTLCLVVHNLHVYGEAVSMKMADYHTQTDKRIIKSWQFMNKTIFTVFIPDDVDSIEIKEEQNANQ